MTLLDFVRHLELERAARFFTWALVVHGKDPRDGDLVCHTWWLEGYLIELYFAWRKGHEALRSLLDA